MKSRGFSCLVLGIWLACGMAVFFAGVDNSRNVERMVRDPNAGAALRMQKLGERDSILLLRFAADKENRRLAEVWANVQFGLSFIFFFYLLFATGENKAVLAGGLALVVIVAIQRFFVIPEVAGLGKLLDFIPDSDPSTYRGRYHAMRMTYLCMEIVKWVMQGMLAAYFCARTRRISRNAGNQLNVVNKTDYGHIDR